MASAPRTRNFHPGVRDVQPRSMIRERQNEALKLELPLKGTRNRYRIAVIAGPILHSRECGTDLHSRDYGTGVALP